MTSNYLLNTLAYQEKRSGVNASKWDVLKGKLRQNVYLKEDGTNVNVFGLQADSASENCIPNSLVESLTNELAVVRERLERVESIKHEFLTFFNNLEEKVEKSRCTSNSLVQLIKLRNESLMGENTRLADEIQQLKRENSQIVDDYSKREMEYMNHINEVNKSLQHTQAYYEAKIGQQYALIGTLCHEIKQWSGLPIRCVDESMEAKLEGPLDLNYDVASFDLHCDNDIDWLAVAGRRVPLLES